MSEDKRPIGLAKLKYINDNVEAAQQHKGGFLLVQCEQYEQCLETLTNVFSEDKMATQVEVDALLTLTNLCEVQNSKGIFSIKGSVSILKALREIKEVLDDIKDPALKFKELQDSLKHETTSKKSKSKH